MFAQSHPSSNLSLRCLVFCLQVISFLVLATIVFFLVVLPTQSLLDHYFVSPCPWPSQLQCRQDWLHGKLPRQTACPAGLHIGCCMLRVDVKELMAKPVSQRGVQPKKPKATCPTCLEEVHAGALRCK